MNIMILAPHQDDEILGAGGLIQICRSRGDTVKVVFATNGDYQGRSTACRRYHESRDALARLGISENEIYYLGYGDTGMHPNHSFLRRLLLSPMDAPLASPISSVTYHPAGRRTVRSLRTGQEGLLTKRELLLDLAWCFGTNVPDLLVVPSLWDTHGDHAALAALVELARPSAVAVNSVSFLIHGGDDWRWPPRKMEPAARPPVVPREVWDARITLALTPEQQALKRHLIGTFSTQTPQNVNGFLYAFAREEVFFSLYTHPTR